MFSKLITFSALLAFAAAECPGDGSPCSGHGSCGAFDSCTCYANWQGPGCADRTCPFATSWNSLIMVSESATTAGASAATTGYEHGYTECASKGECNRKTGECECIDGFTGSACRRMTCDGDGNCNGHGTCMSLDTIQESYTGWDRTMMQKCMCDPGYEGDACEKRICPYGDDPITTSSLIWDSGSSVYKYYTQADDTQTLTFGTAAATTTCESSPSTCEKFFLRYTDYRNMTWDTMPIQAFNPTAIEIEEALEALPNMAIPEVEVDTSNFAYATGTGSIDIKFIHHSNSGLQPLLEVIKAGCTLSGCQPKYIGSSTLVVTVAHASFTGDKTNEEFASCSKRGTCNGETGDCECYPGYTGQACQTQTIIV